MKPSEFYENYWKIDDGKGNLISPPKLSRAEKDFMDNAMKNVNIKGLHFGRIRKRSLQISADKLKEAMEKFPKYFLPANQPELDKYGQIKKRGEPKTPLSLTNKKNESK